jgi:hypothetical protein
MNLEKLKLHAELLESAIQENKEKNKDVEWLSKYPPLVKAIKDAKQKKITVPQELGDGLSRWVFESEIQKNKDVSERLSEFKLLLRGWELPSDS